MPSDLPPTDRIRADQLVRKFAKEEPHEKKSYILNFGDPITAGL